MDPNIDLDRYRGLSAEEARRRRNEDRLRAIREDPRYIAVVRQGQRERAARGAEAEQRRRREAPPARSGAA
jgi:hypothetical protein